MAAPRSTRANVLGVFLCAAVVLLFCLILLWRDPLVFWNDDYQISILPVFEDIARAWRDGHLPLLSPYSWVCGNLAGEFQYGTFSIFVNAAVVVIWAVFHNFANQAAALSIVHLIVVAIGAFLLARNRNLSLPLAMMVAMVAALNGWILCWGATDWFGALGAFAWLPWAWLGCEKALAATSSRWRFFWPAPFVYLVATGGFPYTIGMLGLLVSWMTVRSMVRTRTVTTVVPMLVGVALGFGLATPAIFALLSYVHGSAREAQPASAHWQWIVPPSALPALIVPSWTVKWADFSTRYMPHPGTELAAGLVAPAALIAALVTNARSVLRRLRWELALLALILIIAMLPTAGLFRWSFRWLPFFHLVLAICAAESLALLGDDPARRWNLRMSPAMVALVLSGLFAVMMMFFHTGGKYAVPLTPLVVGTAAVWLILERLLMEGRAPASPVFSAPSAAWPELHSPSVVRQPSSLRLWIPAVITIASLMGTYLCIPPNCGVPRFNFTEALRHAAPLDPQRLYLSIYPPAEDTYRMETRPEPVGQIVRPGSTSMWGQLHFINGYSPIRPSGVARAFFFSIHGETDLGTATWLLFGEGGPEALLARIGIDGLTIAREIELNPEPGSDWELVTSNSEGRVFHRRGGPLPRVRSFTSVPSRRDSDFVSASISAITESRNSIAADIDVPEGQTPALIAFSRPYFDGYRATLNGRSVAVASDRHLYPVVELPAGSRGRLELRYRPDWLIYGGAVSIVCAAAVAVGMFMALRRD
jgi:hypothetical protein